MLEIEEMRTTEMHRLLKRVGYGHLGLARNNRPHVVPINYAYHDPHIFIYTTEGEKTRILAENPEVCLQIEEVHDAKNWQSVIAVGIAELLTDKDSIDDAMRLIRESNPTLTPAQSLMWIDAWGRANISAVYRVLPHMMSGRATVPAGETRGSASDQ